MSGPAEAPRRPAPYRGLTFFVRGLLLALFVGGFVLYLWGSGRQPSNRAAIAILIVGGIAALTMLWGVLLELYAVVRHGQMRGLGILAAFLLLVGGSGYYGYRQWNGEAIPGDDLVPLLGEPRDSPAVQSAIGRLGWNRSTYDSHIHWREQNVDFHFDDDGRLSRIELGGSYSRYRGGLPYGLKHDEHYSEVVAQLGEPDAPPAEKKFAGSSAEIMYAARGLKLSFDFSNKLGKVDLVPPKR